MTDQKTELTIVERAQQALTIKQTEQELIDLAANTADITEIKSPADYALVKRAGIVLRDVRISIEKAGKLARDDANAFRSAVLDEQRRLIILVSPEEDRLKALRKVEDDKKAAIIEEQQLVKEARQRDLRLKMNAISELAQGRSGLSADDLSGRLTTAKSIVVDETEFPGYAAETQYVKDSVIDAIETALSERIRFDDQQAEQERIAKEQAEKQAELDRQAEEQAEQNRIEQDRIAKEQNRIAEQQAAIDAENKRIADKEQAKKDAQAQADKEARDKLEKEQRDREHNEQMELERIAEEERQEALKPEKQRLIDWLTDIKQNTACPKISDETLDELGVDVAMAIVTFAHQAIEKVKAL